MISEKQTSLQFDKNHKRDNQGLLADFNKMRKRHEKVFAYSVWQGKHIWNKYLLNCTIEAVRSL